MPSGLCYLNALGVSFSKRRGVWLVVIITLLLQCSAASDLGLHCLPMSLLLDTRHKWVKNNGRQQLINYSTEYYLSS